MLTPTVVLAGMGLVAGLGLAVAARAFAVETDPRQDAVADLLPGANCGGCGCAGCADFAAAVVGGRAGPTDCPVCDAAARGAIAAVMGLEAGETIRRVALVRCQGGDDAARRAWRYNGDASCASLHLLAGGDKQCRFGCLGLADCQAACAFGAVEITADGLARILPGRCTGCGRCVAACPRDVIAMVPASARVHVLCVNTDKGAAAKKACDRACIGCRKCEKSLGDEAAIRVAGCLARVDYDRAPDDDALAALCPTGAIVVQERLAEAVS